MAEGEEKDLLERAKGGDRDAFAELFRRRRGLVVSTVRRILGSSNDIEDVVNDAFLNALRSIAQFREQSLITTWLYRIAVNAAIDHLRKTRPHLYVSSDDDRFIEQEGLNQMNSGAGSTRQNGGEDHYSPFRARENEKATREDELRIIDLALKGWAPRKVSSIRLRLDEELKAENIATVLGISVGMVFDINKEFARRCLKAREDLHRRKWAIPAGRFP